MQHDTPTPGHYYAEWRDDDDPTEGRVALTGDPGDLSPVPPGYTLTGYADHITRDGRRVCYAARLEAGNV